MLLGYPLRQDLPSIYGTWIPFRKQNRCPATCLQHLQQETNRNRGRLSANMFCSIKLTASESFRCRICSGDSNFADRLPLQRSLRKYIASQRFAYNCASESSKRHQKTKTTILVYTLLFVIQMSSKFSFKTKDLVARFQKINYTQFGPLPDRILLNSCCCTPKKQKKKCRIRKITHAVTCRTSGMIWGLSLYIPISHDEATSPTIH